MLDYAWFAGYVNTLSRQSIKTIVKAIALAPHRSKGLWTFRDNLGRELALPDVCRRDFNEERMKQNANARFAITSWDEKPYSEGLGLPKLTRASVVKALTGDIEGESQSEYLMMYREDGSASFVGLERVVGRIGEKSGTFVLQRSGAFESGQAKESYTVVSGSATGELAGLRGEGSSDVGHGLEHPFSLHYELV